MTNVTAAPSLRRLFLESMGLALLLLLFSFAYQKYQPQILAGGGYGWDGIEYSKIFALFRGGPSDSIAFPFCNRIGTPYLAHLLGSDTSTSFRQVNVIASFVFSITIYLTSRFLRFGVYWSFFAGLLTIIPFFAPLRFTYFYPVYTDPVFLALLSVSFLCVVRRAYVAAFVILVTSFPFREASVYLLPFYAWASLFLGCTRKRLLIVLLASIIAISLAKSFISIELSCHGSQLKTAIFNAWELISDPQRFVSVVAAISMTAAPLVYINSINKLSKLHIVSLIGLLISFVLASVGGSDSTRIFYSFFPLYYILLISVLRSLGVLYSLFAGLGYLVVNRFPRVILEPLNYWPSRDDAGLFWQFPDHARPEVALLILSSWFIIFGLYEIIARSKLPGFFESLLRRPGGLRRR
jgi:hypothetical protein